MRDARHMQDTPRCYATGGVTVVADRGFGNGPLFQYLSEELGFEYVIRLRGDIYVTSAKGERRKASDWVGVNGRSRTLRGATVTDAHALPVGTVVCVHAKAMKEPVVCGGQ